MCVHMHQYLRQLFSRGTPYGCGLPMGMCLICLAWAALWLRSPYGRVLNMFGMGRPLAAATLWLRPLAGGEYAKPVSLGHSASSKNPNFFK